MKKIVSYQDRHSCFYNNVECIVDGRYMEQKNQSDLLFRGSSNQRIIDVQQSLLLEVVFCDQYMERIKKRVSQK